MPPTPRVSRRTLATGAAWTAPAVAFATAAPAQAASTGKVAIKLTLCREPPTHTVVGIYFEVSAIGADVLAGSTFVLSTDSGDTTARFGGDLTSFASMSGSGPWTFTLDGPLPDGTAYTLWLLVSPSPDSTWTLATGTILGNANGDPNSNSASKILSSTGGC